jgi:hypothetical protein
MDYDDSYDWYDDRPICENCERPTMDLSLVDVLVEHPENPWYSIRIVQYWCYRCRERIH